MKTLLLLCTALLFASCISVDDWGAYWAKGTVADKELVGKWKRIEVPGKPTDDKGVEISIAGGNYQIDSLDEKEKQRKDYAPLAARLLKVGDYTFLMAGVKAKDGGLIRYRIKDGVLTNYSLKAGALKTFLKEKFPNAKNIGTNKCDPECRSLFVKIGTFDDQVFQVLSWIPDSKTYWETESRYRKMVIGTLPAVKK